MRITVLWYGGTSGMATKYFGITIDGSTDKKDWNTSSTPPDDNQYEASIITLLDKIKQNLAGAAILGFIEGNKHQLTIIPYTDLYIIRHNKKRCNASTDPDLDADGHPEGKEWYTNADLHDKSGAREDTSGKKGTGRGSDVHVCFNPNQTDVASGKGTSCFTSTLGGLPDEVLFHEIIHALRFMKALDLGKPTYGKNLEHYDNEEEFLAIVITNVYMSAWGLKDFRADHFGYKKAPYQTTADFLSDADNLKTLTNNYADFADVYQLLALIPGSVAAFNPFRELVNNGPKYGQPAYEKFLPWF
ncbi:MAG: hypothetical protein ACJ8FY_00725 [Gemmataceae bacterium]